MKNSLLIHPELLLYYHGIGDALLFNAVLHDLGKQNSMRYLVGSPHAEIYRGNPYVIHLPFSQAINYKIARVLKLLGMGGLVTHVNYYHESKIPKKHILQLLSERFGLRKIPAGPLLILSDEEKATRLLPTSEKPWVAIQSMGMKKWTDNKNWGVSNFQEVVRLLSYKYSFVQLGPKGDLLLEGATDLTGKLSLRQVVSVMRECKSFIGQEGFLMHAAASQHVPSVIVYGGFLAPWQSGFTWNVNLFTPLECSPCWLEGTCPWEKKCMTMISPGQVVREHERMIENPSVETLGIVLRNEDYQSGSKAVA